MVQEIRNTKYTMKEAKLQVHLVRCLLCLQFFVCSSFQFVSFHKTKCRNRVSISPKRVDCLSKHHSVLPFFSVTSGEDQIEIDLDAAATNLNSAMSECSDYFKDCKIRSGKSLKHRLGLFAKQFIKKGDAVLSVPFGDDNIILTPRMARKTYSLPNTFSGWTGDAGLLAALLMNEYASATANRSDRTLATRKPTADSVMKAWLLSLPTEAEIQSICPLLWEEVDQELFQKSSTKNLYQFLDDMEEDYKWFQERIWSQDEEKYPKDLFTLRRFLWAMAVVSTRSVFVNGAQVIAPVIDICNHDDVATEEVRGGFTGVFGSTACVQIKAGKDYYAGDEIFVSYGPKSAAEYLLDYGFIPPLAYKEGATAELTFEINDQDQFLEDKLDILEFHTDQNGPMDPIQSFDISAMPGRDSSPDPKMIQFLRLKKLGGLPKPLDAFLLESIFRKDVWGFMSLPVSEMNERAVVGEIIATCAEALEKMGSVEETDEAMFSDPFSPKSLCRTVRSLESKALTRMLEHMQREGEALDLKEYYQERRLRELGMDSEWDPDAMNSDVEWGQKRVPGGGDLDF